MIVFNSLSVERQDIVEARVTLGRATTLPHLRVRARTARSVEVQIVGHQRRRPGPGVPGSGASSLRTGVRNPRGPGGLRLRSPTSGSRNQPRQRVLSGRDRFQRGCRRPFRQAPREAAARRTCRPRAATGPLGSMASLGGALRRTCPSPAARRLSAPAKVPNSGIRTRQVQPRSAPAGGRIRLHSTLSLTAGDAGRRVRSPQRRDLAHPGHLLKAAFPVTTTHPQATYDLGLGVIERGNNRRESYEVPAQQWADLSSKERRRRALGAQRLEVRLGQAGRLHPPAVTAALSEGHPEVSTSGLPGLRASTDSPTRCLAMRVTGRDADTVWHAARLNQPLMVFHSRPHAGPLGKELGFVESYEQSRRRPLHEKGRSRLADRDSPSRDFR